MIGTPCHHPMHFKRFSQVFRAVFARYNSWNLSFEVSTEFSNVSMLEIALELSVLFSWICIIIFSILICGHTDGASCLHYAALEPSKTEHAKVQVIKVAGAIMERGVIELISQADLHSGLTPLDCAVYVGNDALARMLAEAGQRRRQRRLGAVAIGWLSYQGAQIPST